MAIKKKQYIGFYYPNSEGKHEVLWDSVASREIISIESSFSFSGFRFYDVYVFSKDGVAIIGDPCNYSKLYCLGDRLSIDQLGDDELSKRRRDYLIENGLESAIFCYNGAIITDDDAITLEELGNNKKQVIDYKVCPEEFFEGLASIFDRFEKNVLFTDKGEVVYVDFDDKSEEERTLKTYSIFIDGSLVVSCPVLLDKEDDDRLGQGPDINLSEAFAVAESLYDDYPYLLPIMDRLKIKIGISGVDNLKQKMEKSARFYAGYGDKLSEAVSYVKRFDEVKK